MTMQGVLSGGGGPLLARASGCRSRRGVRRRVDVGCDAGVGGAATSGRRVPGAEFEAAVKVQGPGWRSVEEIHAAYAIRVSEAERILPARPVYAVFFENVGALVTTGLREFDMRVALLKLVGALAACSYAASLWARIGPVVMGGLAAYGAPLAAAWAAAVADPTSIMFGFNRDVVATYAGIVLVLWMMVGGGGKKDKAVVVSQNLPLSINLTCYRVIRAFTYALSEHYRRKGRDTAADVVRAMRPPLCQMLCAVLWALLFILILNLVPESLAFEYAGPFSPLRYLDLNGDGTLTGAEFQHNLLIVCAKVLAATCTAILGGFVLGIESEVVRRMFPPETRSKAVQSEIDFTSSLFRIVVNSVVAISVLDAVGVPTGTLLALGGVSGVAIGFGAQSTMTNLFSAVTILLNSRFRAGDYVRLHDGQIVGTVEKIGWFSTQLIDDDGFHITLANKDVVETPMVNISRRDFWVVNGAFAVECPCEKVKPIQQAVHTACRTYPIALTDSDSMDWTGCWYDGTTAADKASANPQAMHKFSFSISLDAAIARPIILTHKSDLLMAVGEIIVAHGGKLLSCDSGAPMAAPLA